MQIRQIVQNGETWT